MTGFSVQTGSGVPGWPAILTRPRLPGPAAKGGFCIDNQGCECEVKEPTKIEFRHRRIRQLSDYTEVVELLFPGNRNLQHAAARILLELKWAQRIVPNLVHLEDQYGISRRTLQRARAKLARLGLIERVTWMNSRYGGQQGWKLSGRFSSSLRALADKLDRWQKDTAPHKKAKESLLADLLR